MTDPPQVGLEAILHTARRIWEEREDVRRTYGEISSMGYWSWLMSQGAREHPEVLINLPVPGPELMERVGEANLDHFLGSGIANGAQIFECLREGGFDPERVQTLLDFGCGCGRILRIAARFADCIDLFGADVDAEAIGWCRENLDFAAFEAIDPHPPAPYSDGRFDAVYSYSIFTHLSQELGRAWLEELHRILRPGGVLVLTVAGRRVIEKFLAGDVDARLQIPSPDELRADLAEIEERGFRFYAPGTRLPWIPSNGSGEEVYGMTFVLERHVREHWLDLFELIAYHEAPQDWQDYLVLRRR